MIRVALYISCEFTRQTCGCHLISLIKILRCFLFNGSLNGHLCLSFRFTNAQLAMLNIVLDSIHAEGRPCSLIRKSNSCTFKKLVNSLFHQQVMAVFLPMHLIEILVLYIYVPLSHLRSKESQCIYITYSTSSGMLTRYTHCMSSSDKMYLVNWWHTVHIYFVNLRHCTHLIGVYKWYIHTY